MSKIHVHTLGCKLNYSEGSSIERHFVQQGYEPTSSYADADIFILNTCSVTENADTKCRKIIRQAKQCNPNIKTIVIGCYAQLKPKEILEMTGVDMVLGAAEKFNVVEHVKRLEQKNTSIQICSPIDEIETFEPSYSWGERTRSFLKVQDGCDYSCSFCTIPLARGKSRSGSIELIKTKFEEILKNGVKEVVLSGVNIGDVGLMDGKRAYRLIDLIRALDNFDEEYRVRISSIEPNLLSDDIVKFVSASNHFMPHFHIPLQSGCDKILKKMQRRYLAKLYKERIESIKTHIPDACIGIDVIVGFPGESDTDFLETYNFLHSLEWAYLHVFTYSERKNTLAADMSDKIPEAVKNERRKVLESLSLKKKEYFYKQHLYKTHEVLFEKDTKENKMFGFTPNYIKVKHDYRKDWINKIIPMYLGRIDSDLKATAAHAENELVNIS